MSFWSELKRRNVFKVAIAYLVVAWLILQVVSIVFPMLNLPSWAGTFVTVLLIIGFPIVLIFAWAFEITPEGLKLTKDVSKDESITHLTGQKLNYVLIGVIVLAVAFILFDNLYLDRRAIETEVASRVAELAPPTVDEEEGLKTIAVLPFENLSSDPEQEYFVDGLSEELLNSLTKIEDLQVIARTSSFAFKGTEKKVQEIADELGASHILEGSVRKSGNALRITAQLIRGVDGIHLWSETYNRKLEDIFAIQEDIATAVAKELKITLGIDNSFKQLGSTDNEKAYELYMIAKAQYREGPKTVERALESINAAIGLDPQFSLGWALKSQIHQGLIANLPSNEWAPELDNSLKAANRAIELEPNLAAGHFSLGLVRSSMSEWIEAQLAFNKALQLTEPSLSYEVEHPDLYGCVGHLEKFKALYEAQIRNNPLNGNFRGLYISCLALLGDIQLAEEEYQRGKVLLGDQWALSSTPIWGISLARISTGNSVSSNDLPYSSTVWDIIKKNLNSPKEALEELRKIYAENNNLNPFDIEDISIWAAYYGDPALAMEALEKALNDVPTEVYYFWLPIMKDVRQLPRFKELVRESGLVDYWNEFGWPDICQPTGDGDFVCD